jgi:hypothetical protein
LSTVLKHSVFNNYHFKPAGKGVNCQLSIVNGRFAIFMLLLALFFCGLPQARAQLNNAAFEDWYKIDTSNARKLYLGTNIFMFQKDNEYFNQIVDGYTLFGYQFNPKLIYFPSKNVRIDGGIFLSKDFGNDAFTQIAPTFSVKIKNDSFELTLGTLQGSLNHRLVEPIYNFERVIGSRLENGIQMTWNKKRFFIDQWIAWEKMQYYGSTYQEQVWGGISTVYKPIMRDKFELHIPLQSTAIHQGGQIDINPSPLTTLLNSAGGLTLLFRLSSTGFLKGIRADNYFVDYHDFSFVKARPYNLGHGIYSNLTFNTKLCDIMFSFWNGHHYYGIKGGDLYQSVSKAIGQPGYLEPNRELLILRILKDIRIMEGMMLSSRFEPYYDFIEKRTEFSFGLYLNYRPMFFISKIKHQQ